MRINNRAYMWLEWLRAMLARSKKCTRSSKLAMKTDQLEPLTWTSRVPDRTVFLYYKSSRRTLLISRQRLVKSTSLTWLAPNVLVKLVPRATHWQRLKTSTRVWLHSVRSSTHSLMENQHTCLIEIPNLQDFCRNLSVVTPWPPWSSLVRHQLLTKKRLDPLYASVPELSRLKTRLKWIKNSQFKN